MKDRIFYEELMSNDKRIKCLILGICSQLIHPLNHQYTDSAKLCKIQKIYKKQNIKYGRSLNWTDYNIFDLTFWSKDLKNSDLRNNSDPKFTVFRVLQIYCRVLQNQCYFLAFFDFKLFDALSKALKRIFNQNLTKRFNYYGFEYAIDSVGCGQIKPVHFTDVDRIFWRSTIMTVSLTGQMTARQKVGRIFDRPFFFGRSAWRLNNQALEQKGTGPNKLNFRKIQRGFLLFNILIVYTSLNLILKVINAYCSTSFTIMSTNLDAAISVPWSSSVTSIVSLGSDPNNPNQSSCLFDLVNGLYLIDSHFVERSFKYLRGIDVNYLEFYEKYFILYNSACLNDFKMAAQYLWLFQKLSASSIPTSVGIIENMSHKVEQSDLFKIFPKTISVDTNSQCSILKHEQMMHARLMLTIYLANSLVNEAYELIKPHIVHLKTCGASAGKPSKQLICHFFSQSEMFKQWKQISKLTSVDSDFLLVLLNYLEAKKEPESIGKAIDLHVNNRNYKKAIQLYEKHHQLFASSTEFAYLSSMIEIAKEMHNDYTTESLNQYNLITSTDLRNNLVLKKI
ncbi:hypothetical protein BpHYR1_053728 [Brachionus plicatilis]|uniref:Uncharacterized protein n=1 Tax=Brachionus plicatilis TaxID=10195 RepID=A0A3M7Q459_BRAPC|nr:hypothetical protein BpHYR1_053728 [Brachionus plicatilis]